MCLHVRLSEYSGSFARGLGRNDPSTVWYERAEMRKHTVRAFTALRCPLQLGLSRARYKNAIPLHVQAAVYRYDYYAPLRTM